MDRRLRPCSFLMAAGSMLHIFFARRIHQAVISNDMTKPIASNLKFACVALFGSRQSTFCFVSSLSIPTPVEFISLEDVILINLWHRSESVTPGADTGPRLFFPSLGMFGK